MLVFLSIQILRGTKETKIRLLYERTPAFLAKGLLLNHLELIGVPCGKI